MKLALSIALLGLFAIAALARTDVPRKEFKFTPGKIQTYEYRGRLVNGIPKLANQYSGLQVECKVVVHPANDQQIVMKLEDIRVGELPHNHNVEHYERIDSDKFDVVYNQNKELTEEYQRELVRPIRFTYINGKVHGFEADSEDLEWSVNMKKSILALFQLELTPSKIIKSTSANRRNDRYENDVSIIVDPITGERRAGQWSPEEVISQSGEMPQVYPIYEESYQGICETQYQVDSNENVDQQQQQQQSSWNNNNVEQRDIQVLNVTKTINFKNCLTDPSVSYDQHVYGGKSATTKSWQKSWLQQQRLAQYNAVPEEIKTKYSNVFTSTGAKDNVAAPQQVDRYSFIKYNITQHVPTGMSVIEGVLAEGKIKYQAEGDELVSISHQKLKLLYVEDEQKYSSNQQQQQQSTPIKQWQQTEQTQTYTTIQCEMTQQKMKFYQDVMRQATSKLSLDRQSSATSGKSGSTMMPPFAQSASWYSLVADEEDIRSYSPEKLTQQLEQLLVQLVEDVQAEIVEEDTKKAGHRVVQIVHLVANLPKQKLAEFYEQIVARLPTSRNQNTMDTITSQDDTEAEYKIMRKLFLDSLPLAGSKQSVKLIEELIANKRVTAWEAKELVESVPQNIRYPDKEIIDAFVRLTQSPFVREHQTLKMSTSIACAKMIANAYARSKDLGFKSTVYENKLPVHLRDDSPARSIAEEADPRQESQQRHHQQQQQQRDWQDDDVTSISEQDILKYVKHFKNMLEKSRTYHDRVTYIETLAHMKVPQVLPVLQPYISGRISLNQCLNSKSYDDELTFSQHQRNQHQYRQWRQQQQQQQQHQYQEESSKDSKDWSDKDGKDAEECNFLRTIAIYGSAHLARSSSSESSQLLPLVLPVFDNTYEPYQIRIAAFTIATICDIDEHTLERIASQMWREPSKQVASIVVGTLDTLANMTHPKMAKIAYAARKACDSMPKQYLNTWRYSWLAGGDHYNNEKEQGLNWMSELVKSNVSSVPRAGYVHFGRSHGPAAQNYDNKIELGWTAKGLEQFMDEYLENEQGSILATIFQQIKASSEDIEQYYQDARDSLYESSSSSSSRSSRQQQQQQSYVKRAQQQRFGRSVNGEESEKLFGNKQSSSSSTKSHNQDKSSYYSRDGQSYSWESSQEEPKLALFAKLFDQTSYLALDKQQMMTLARDFDLYITEMGKELIQGGKLNYVKMIMPSSMWQMVPSQIGLPVFITHRKPIIVSVRIDGTNTNVNQQQTTARTNQQQQQQQKPTWSSVGKGQFNQLGQDSLSVFVHPKIIHSSYRFMFTVDQAKKVAYGVQTEKSHQVSLPMTMSVAYSQPKQLISFALAPVFLKTSTNNKQYDQFWSVEAAKTFVGDVTLIHYNNKQQTEQNWLGDEKIIRAKSTDNIRSPSSSSDAQSNNQMRLFDDVYSQKWLGLDVVVKGITDDDEFDWTFDMENKNQHRESGPFSKWLHILDELTNRPCKYSEVMGYLRPDQAHKQPVYKFEWALEKPLNRWTIMQQKQQQWRQQQPRDGVQINNNQQQQQQSWSEQEQEQEQTVQKHTAVIRDEQDNGNICFSTKPVNKCPKGTDASETITKDTPFTCLSQNEFPQLRHWVEEASEKVLSEMHSMRTTFVRSYTQPRMCSVY